MSARVIVLAGPSGAGKSRLAERLGWPVLRLDDFYRDADDPALPRLAADAAGDAGASGADWDDPRSWHLDRALAAINGLCSTGRTEVPVYSIPLSRAVSTHTLDLEDSPFFVAEGIFAPHVVASCERAGQLEAAYCITQRPVVTFGRRLYRDLRERRKPPLVLLRRGLSLMRSQRARVADAVALGCRVATADQAYADLQARQAVGR